MKSILQSIKPQYCELIASGKKTIEIRKTRPKLDVPFKVYIYCTKDKEIFYQSRYRKGFIAYKPKFYKDTETLLKQKGHTVFNGKVIGEYVCDEIINLFAYGDKPLTRPPQSWCYVEEIAV